jgi:hypothetical protein
LPLQRHGTPLMPCHIPSRLQIVIMSQNLKHRFPKVEL